MGIFENNLKRYLIYSNLIQLSFLFFDLGVAKLSQKLTVLGTIQIFNYTIAGILFFITLGILSKNGKKKTLGDLNGIYYSDKFNSSFSVISALSLAGLPGLNIFVSEWLLFKSAFMINPVITIFGIFAALLLFIMYFKIVNILLTGESKVKMRPMRLLTHMNSVLAFLCLLLGLIPQIQLYLLKMVV